MNRRMPAWALLAGLLAFQACDDDDTYYYDFYPNALVTVKHAEDRSVYLQLDDSTTLLPVNMRRSPYGEKEVRALVNYTPLHDDSGVYSYSVQINWIDSILTKPAVSPEEADSGNVYGNDPVEIINDWVTIAEDGYLTLCFRTRWEGRNTHYVNLLAGRNPDDPYEVEFRHNAYGDTQGVWGNGLVAFRLDCLPDTEGKTVKLTLKWNSFSGVKTAQFDYCTRRSTPPASAGIAGIRSALRLE